jgi:hypothetical protein
MLRVVQWATGTVGRHAVAAIASHPELQLVGALVYSAAKAGRDVGELCGLGPLGITTTTDPDDIVAQDADCVLYMPQGEMNPMGPVCAAAPGIRTFLDLPTIMGRGVLSG